LSSGIGRVTHVRAGAPEQRDGRRAPADLRANDIAHWQTTLVMPLSLGFRSGVDLLVLTVADSGERQLRPGLRLGF